jgi:hypothetical protein
MEAKSKRLDAVAEETEGMTPDEALAYFDRAAVRRHFEEALPRGEQAGEAKVGRGE